jgi:hypothetical protein
VHRRARLPGPPYDALELARALGFDLCTERHLGGPDGILVGRTIALVESLDQQTAALTIAHEIAHALDDEFGGTLDGTADFVERQMDLAAAAILGW